MSTILLGTFLMMVAAFLIGLAVSYLIRIIANILYYSETGSLSHDIAKFRRLYRIRHNIRSEVGKQLSVGHSENDLINYYYGNKCKDNHLVDYYGGN